MGDSFALRLVCVEKRSAAVVAYNPLDPDGDPFRPPALSTIVHCLHCGEEYDSYRIEWHVETDHRGQPHGFWCCPIQNCGGRGFGFDIFPVDPEYRDEDGNKMWTGDDEEEEWSEEQEDGINPGSDERVE
jgi:hypothetical protein